MLIRPIIPLSHYRPKSSWSSVENTDLVLLYNVPEPIRMGIIWYPFKHKNRCSISQRTVNDIGVPSDPTNVGCAPEKVFFLHVKDPLKVLLAVAEITCMRSI